MFAAVVEARKNVEEEIVEDEKIGKGSKRRVQIMPYGNDSGGNWLQR